MQAAHKLRPALVRRLAVVADDDVLGAAVAAAPALGVRGLDAVLADAVLGKGAAEGAVDVAGGGGEGGEGGEGLVWG